MDRPVTSLSVDADLAVTIDGRECAVWTEDDTVVLNAPSLAAARTLLDGVDALPAGQRRLVAGLRDASLAVEVKVRYAPVARVGADVEPSTLAALAGYDAAVSAYGVAVAAWRALG